MDETGIDQQYVIDDSSPRRMVVTRDVDTFLPFLVPRIRPRMGILDAGCVTGSIALDLAAKFAPHRIVGIDFDPGQIEEARRSAADRRLSYVEVFNRVGPRAALR